MVTEASDGAELAVEAPQQRIEPAKQTLSCGLDLTPGGGQTGTGRVQQVPFRVDAIAPAAARGSYPAAVERARWLSGASIGHPLEIGVHRRAARRPVQSRELNAFENAALDPKPRRAPG